MALQDTAAIQALSAKWWELKNSGATQAQLDKVHQEAQLLRAASGYTADASGTIYKALKSAGETLTGTGVEELVEQAAVESGEVYVFSDGAGYDPGMYTQTAKIDGESIAGYAVLALVGLAVINKVLS